VAEPQNGKFYCYLETNDITTPYIYAWDCMDRHFSGLWSGTKMQQVGVAPNGKKVYCWTDGNYNVDSIPQFLIFNDGKAGGKQTADLDFVNGGYYTLDGLIGIVPGHEDPITPEQMYVMGEVNNNGGWFANKGVKMKSNDGNTFTATVVTTGQNAGYSYFSFSKKIAKDPTDWITISRYRIGARTPEEDLEVTDELLGTMLPLDCDGSTKAFKIGAGVWKLTLDLTERTLIVAQSDGLPGDIDGNGKVNVSDVTTLVNMILGVVEMNEQKADVNGDGKVNVSDVTALINIILGVA
jgi:hypothetical protein